MLLLQFLSGNKISTIACFNEPFLKKSMPLISPPTLSCNASTVLCAGNWTVSQNVPTLLEKIKTLSCTGPAITIDTSKLSQLDTAGAWILNKIDQALTQKGYAVEYKALQSNQAALLELVTTEAEKISHPILPPKPLHWIAELGKKSVDYLRQAFELIAFLGEICTHLFQMFRSTFGMQWKSFSTTVEETGYKALGIVGLLCALIGIVLAYQMGQQLKIYGANIFIVGVLGVGVLQEFAPLITAIIVAGRTASAFTAQIGSMQVNQEIDALRTMGLSPIDRLVIPKILGLMIALPLLVVWADIFGIFGGMLVAKHMLGIGFYNFLATFPRVIETSTFLNGLLKAPVYAAIIAGIGCFQGFKVRYTADSVGKHTTKSVVQAIFLIIVVDAIFSILLPWQTLS
jgi:phospholipid/cholesterol/gamma-HCH transport system permease protein